MMKYAVVNVSKIAMAKQISAALPSHSWTYLLVAVNGEFTEASEIENGEVWSSGYVQDCNGKADICCITEASGIDIGEVWSSEYVQERNGNATGIYVVRETRSLSPIASACGADKWRSSTIVVSIISGVA